LEKKKNGVLKLKIMISYNTPFFKTLLGIRAFVIFMAIGLGIIFSLGKKFDITDIRIMVFTVFWILYGVLFIYLNLKSKKN